MKTKGKNEMNVIKINTPYIKLIQFLKFSGYCDTGGEANQIIMDGEIIVNGQKEKRRGRKLKNGDKVSIRQDVFIIRQDGGFYEDRETMS